MIKRSVRIQLVVFTVVAVAAVGYGAFRFAGVDTLVKPPYTVYAQFEHFGGIYPQAGVDLLGVRVGEVRALRVGPGNGTTVEMVIDHGVRIPAEATATVRTRSALGEQYVSLVPKRAGGPALGDGSVIPIRDTAGPPRVDVMLRNLNGFAASLPKRDLAISLTEAAAAMGDLGPTLQQLLDDTDALTRSSLANLEDQTALLEDSLIVLTTQVQAGAEIKRFSAELAGLTRRMRELDPTFAQVFAHGIQASGEVVDLLEANERALPVLLTNLLALTDVAAPRLQPLRKTLVLFPWVLELAATTARYCDAHDPKTGEPVPGTCRYDPHTGKPIWSARVGVTVAEPAGEPPFLPCIMGYEGTKKYLPNGEPADGTGPRQRADSPFNGKARCTAPASDPNTPNVRGSQNAQRGPAVHRRSSRTTETGRAGETGVALYNPNSGIVIRSDGQAFQLSGMTGPPPPRGRKALGWLLVQPMTEKG